MKARGEKIALTYAPFISILRVNYVIEKCFKVMGCAKFYIQKSIYVWNSFKIFTWFSLHNWSKGFHKGQESHRESCHMIHCYRRSYSKMLFLKTELSAVIATDIITTFKMGIVMSHALGNKVIAIRVKGNILILRIF